MLNALEVVKNKVSLPYSGWSSAMSALSILVQLHSFLGDEGLHYMPNHTDPQLGMRRFECSTCGHCGQVFRMPQQCILWPCYLCAVPSHI